MHDICSRYIEDCGFQCKKNQHVMQDTRVKTLTRDTLWDLSYAGKNKQTYSLEPVKNRPIRKS